MAELDRIRSNAETLLETVGVTRVVVVDDGYAYGVEKLLGICSEVESAELASLPHLASVQFSAPDEVWTEQVRGVWGEMKPEARREAFAAARRLELSFGDASGDGGRADSYEADNLAATCLAEILGPLGGCEFVTLSLEQWEERRDRMLASDAAPRTLFLFDRDYSDEREGTNDEGFRLIQEVLAKGLGYCGLITAHGRRRRRVSGLEGFRRSARPRSRPVRPRFEGTAQYRSARLLRISGDAAPCRSGR